MLQILLVSFGKRPRRGYVAAPINNGTCSPCPAQPSRASQDLHPDWDNFLPPRIRIAIATSVAALALAGTAAGVPLPTRVPSNHVSASAAPGPAAAPVSAPSSAAATNVALLRPMAPTIATVYEAWKEGNACPGFPQTRKHDLTVGSDLVACGKHLKICINGRCVVAQKRDTGPFRDGRHIDMNFGTMHALGFTTLSHFGVRPVTWAPVKGNPKRSVAAVR